MQREEWRLELISRAQNFLMCQGTIPADEFVTMRSHPDFEASILPAIDQVQASLAAKDANVRTLMIERPGFDLQELLIENTGGQ